MKKIAIHLQTERYLIEETNKAVEEEAKTSINIYIYFQQRQVHTNIIHLNTTGENV